MRCCVCEITEERNKQQNRINSLNHKRFSLMSSVDLFWMSILHRRSLFISNGSLGLIWGESFTKAIFIKGYPSFWLFFNEQILRVSATKDTEDKEGKQILFSKCLLKSCSKFQYSIEWRLLFPIEILFPASFHQKFRFVFQYSFITHDQLRM